MLRVYIWRQLSTHAQVVVAESRPQFIISISKYMRLRMKLRLGGIPRPTRDLDRSRRAVAVDVRVARRSTVQIFRARFESLHHTAHRFVEQRPDKGLQDARAKFEIDIEVEEA